MENFKKYLDRIKSRGYYLYIVNYIHTQSTQAEEIKMKNVSWFVLTESTEYTVAVCNAEDVANYIAEHYMEKCIVRKAEY